MKPETITLTWPEMYLASYVATMRRLGNMRRGLRGRYGAPEREGAYEIDFGATQAEMVASKAFNLFWSGAVGDFGAVDVGGLIQARSIARLDRRLIMHEEDKDHQPFVLVYTGEAPRFLLCGWLWGHEGKRPEFWCDPTGYRPAYFIPQSVLHPIADLREWLTQNWTAQLPAIKVSEAAE